LDDREVGVARLMRSIRRALVGWLAVGLLLAVAAAGAGTYLRARDEANALFDYQLRETAASLTGAPIAAGPPGGGSAPGGAAMVVQIWDKNGVQVYLSQPQRELPQHAQLGFTNIATSQGEWRAFSTIAGDQVVQVAQPVSMRRELAANMALRTITPLLAVVPFLALFVWLTIVRGLRPLDRVAAGLAERSPAALDPLAEVGLPSEVRPLVGALNGLLGRLRHALGAQRAFIADAAHELRTPLTALHLQAQLAERAATGTVRDAALAELKAGLGRAARLVEQLLTLAREEPGVTNRPLAPVGLADLARAVIADHAQLAAAKRIDLGLADGVAEAPAAIVNGDEPGLRTLLSNLVANAVRYTPDGGRIDVAAFDEGGRPTLAVRDSGPGIPPAEHERVFDRFYRAATAGTPGSGLGLAIVRSIAERHGANIILGPGLDGRGLGVTVRFPPADARQPARAPAAA
jgi:two-component system OmpR family sensor kinase